MDTLKLIGVVVLVIGLVMELFDRLYTPEPLHPVSAKERPVWLPWLAWGLSALGGLLLIFA